MRVFELEEEQEDSWLANFVQQIKADDILDLVPEDAGEDMADGIRDDVWDKIKSIFDERATGPTVAEEHPASNRNSPEVGNDGDVANIGPGTGGGNGGGNGGGGPPFGGGGGGGGGSTEQLVDTYTSGQDPLAEGEQLDNEAFNIDIRFYEDEAGAWTDQMKQFFIDAADYLSKVITKDIEFVTLSNGDWIDDVRIDARLVNIDGTNGILGQTGITAIRSTDVVDQDEAYLPGTAFMQFDVADIDTLVADGNFYQVVLHEMTHALGLGGLWEEKGLVADYDNGTKRPNDDVPVFIGTEAMRALDENNDAGEIYEGIDQLYVETDGGSGTAYVHWDEETFGDMLMTGYLDPSAPATLSDISIASLEDMGYETTWVGVDELIA